ncbi:MAG: addiction module component CHP02574 family protein [Bacteroidetes bacterium]|nr:addiction module component CHP02574 family protein [Bacteroidota bacterium]
MLDTQVIKNTQGMPMGVFIPIESWNTIIYQYPDIETLNSDIPEWEKDIINARLEMVQNQPQRLKPIEKLFEIL